MPPTSPQWIEHLHGESEEKNLALTELRQLLMQRLQNAFRDRPDLSSNFVEDVVQDSLLKILDNLESFEGRSQFATWATTIAIRTAFSELRKKQWKNVSLDQVLTGENHSAAIPIKDETAPELESDRSSLIDAMYEAIHQKLTTKQKDALLAELRGMPLEEIARRTESSRNAVYKLTHDARKRLKQCLEDRGYSGADWHTLRT